LFSERRTVLQIDGRDQTKLVTGVEKQIGYVRGVLSQANEETALDVVGALCFPNVDGLPLFGRIEINAILVDGPSRVARVAARPGTLTPDAVQRIWSRLARAFPPA
jgi:hypothetical protein